MEELNKNIKQYLKQKEPEYFEGVELYNQHKNARKNIIMTLNQHWNKGFMHTKLIYELEVLVGIEKHSNKTSVLKHRPLYAPVNLIDQTKEEVPENYEYKVPYNDLPEELKSLVIEKGQLYNALEVSKKELAEIGSGNDVQSVSRRKIIMKDMHRMSDKIKNIHALLLKYEETKKMEDIESEINALHEASGSGAETNDEDDEALESDNLESIFQYEKMDYWQKKDLLKRLRSSVPRQEQRAVETDKAEVKANNQKKAELGRKMIQILEAFFTDNNEPKDEPEAENNEE
ncbi:MAG: hypothetical protein P1P88_01200 [Bacteroidales bacterium]|nr:hypothetical protein [Bacteroidales bacterium]